MAKPHIRGKDLRKIYCPQASTVNLAVEAMERHSLEIALSILKDIMVTPADYLNHPVLGEVARAFLPDAFPTSDNRPADEAP